MKARVRWLGGLVLVWGVNALHALRLASESRNRKVRFQSYGVVVGDVFLGIVLGRRLED